MKAIVLPIFFVLALIAGAPATAVDFDPESACPDYGCSAELQALASGGYVISGEVVLPATSNIQKPPAETARVRNANSTIEQTIPIEWTLRTYICCCAPEWHGEFADILRINAQRGDVLVVDIGSAETCTTSVVVPPPPPRSIVIGRASSED